MLKRESSSLQRHVVAGCVDSEKLVLSNSHFLQGSLIEGRALTPQQLNNEILYKLQSLPRNKNPLQGGNAFVLVIQAYMKFGIRLGDDLQRKAFLKKSLLQLTLAKSLSGPVNERPVDAFSSYAVLS